ncbi:MAG: mechanosensitive ion channel protein MscS [Martelella sp.]|uniref:mechanosensitive ion channel family protein n=1 Tax=unclassified Martelella TaxID=2629616 RepID=UPI000C40F06C|nr:mechanosensitive ion channel family protein [Martelella sp.]MAU19446.1 mechanosensitive ion channel protein MscS [Martelella sp.]|tara:strand:- start:416 stop:1414 length:999 start_codon:yes stop_codon:yes gene_type:complete
MSAYWINAAVVAFLLAAMLLSGVLMKRSRTLSHSIAVHAIFLGAAASLLVTLNKTADQILAHYKLDLVKPGLLDDLTLVAIGLIVMQQAFHLINRLTTAQVNKGSDKTSAISIARILKMAIVLLLLLLFGEHLGLSLSGLMAFGGFGGIAIGIAGRDVLSNMFSGVMLYFDRPFRLGDWIRSPDRDIEGTVEEIGWRMTRITTFDKRPLFVPNSVFSSISVENPGQMRNRRIDTTIGLRYEDADKIAAVVADIRAMLHQSEHIDLNQTLLVYFNDFADSSLNIMVYCFTKTTRWAEWLAIQQDVYLKIVDIVHAHGADFAFPSQTVYLDKDG